jgi:hypothetical protein
MLVPLQLLQLLATAPLPLRTADAAAGAPLLLIH